MKTQDTTLPGSPVTAPHADRSHLVGDVLQERTDLALQDAAERVQRFGVDAGHDGLAHELRERLARDARLRGERVGRDPLLGRHLGELPAYRHGGSVTLTTALDKRKRSAYYSPITQRERVMKASTVKIGEIYANAAGDRIRVLREDAERGGWWRCERVTPTMLGAAGSATLEHSRSLVAPVLQ